MNMSARAMTVATAALAVVVLAGGSAQAGAVKAGAVFLIRQDTFLGLDTPPIEQFRIKILCKQFKDCHLGFSIGEATIDGMELSTLDEGVSAMLNYRIVDAGTGTQQPYGAIAAVRYEVNADPSTNLFTPLGISTDLANNFALPFVVSGFEPQIIAYPLDSAGAPVELFGFEGAEVGVATAVNILPSVSATVPLGLAGLVAVRRRRAR